MAKEKEEKKIKPLAPEPTYTPIDASLNKTYIKSRGALKSNIVVSPSDLAPPQPQATQTLQVRGALAPLKRETFGPPVPPGVRISNPSGLPSMETQLRTATSAFKKPEPIIPPSPPSMEQQLKTATTAFTPQSVNQNLRPVQGPTAPAFSQSSKPTLADRLGLNNPILGPSVEEIGQAVVTDPLLRGISRSAAFGLGEQAMPQRIGEKPTSEKVGEFLGYLQPGAATERLAASALNPVIKNLPKAGQHIARGLGASALFGTSGETAQELGGLNQQTLGQRLGDIGIETGIGGAVPGLGHLAGAGVKLATRNALGGIIGDQLGAAQAIQRAGDSVQTGRLKVAGNDYYVNKVMSEISPIANERITPPTDVVNLAKWLKPHFGDTSISQIRKLPYEDMRELANEVRSTMDPYDIARQVAKEKGYNLDDILGGKASDFKGSLERLRMGRVAGAIEAPQNARVALSTGEPRITQPPIVKLATQRAEQNPQATPLTRPLVDDSTLIDGTVKTGTEQLSDEFKFAKTVRTSSQTDPELARILNDKKLTGSRTSDEANLQAAQNLIDREGAEKVADRIVKKKMMLNAVENTAAQVLARFYSETGQLDKAIEIISKTARSGRELGQAVQALSRWNKLDQEGAILLAERQLNRRTVDTNAWKTLTPEQAAPVQSSAQGIEKVQDVQIIAREVVDMLANRQSGQPFTDAEKALLQNFNKTVTDFDQTVRPILQKEKATRNQTIKEIGAIEPKKRTRDQVVNYLDAQADKAMEALKRQRNLGIVSDQTNPVILYAIIGASKLANGAVKFADWSESMIRSGITDRLSETYVKSVNKFRKENGLPTNQELNRVINAAIKDRGKGIDEETANSLRAMAAEIGFYADDVKLELTQDLQRAMQRIGKSTLGEKISAIDTSFMLLTMPTFERNALGNLSMIFTEKFNKLAAVPIDWAVSKLTGERTVRFNPANQEKFWKNFMVGTVKEGWEGVSSTGTLDSYDLQPNVFGDKNPLRYLTKTLGASLQGFDTASYLRAYGDVMATYGTNLGKAQGLSNAQIRQQMPELIKQLDAKVIEMADQAGLYATFQDDTLLSRGTVAAKRGLNALTDIPARNLRERGILPESISTEGFGLGDVVLKFAKTPANLVMRGIDYSPLGFMRSLVELAPALMGKELRKKFNQREFVLSLSRATVGTLGLTGLGFWLAKNGILTGASSQDRDVRSIQEQAGHGAYKVNLSALSRWVMSMFDEDEAEYVEGDRMLDYAWLQPAAISLGMGVNAAEAMDKPLKPGEERSNFNIATSAILGGLSTILENPLVTGVQNLTEAASNLVKRQDFTGFAQMLQGIPARAIPSIVGQVRTGMDNTQRETFDKRIFIASWNLIKNKLPGASETLPVSYGSLGQPRERIHGGESGSVYNYLTALLSPFKFTEYSVTPEAKIALDLMKESGDPNVLPRIGMKKITVRDPDTKLSKTVDLTNEQFSMLQREMGQEVSQRLLKNAAYFEDPSKKIKNKVDRIKGILTDAGSKAKNQLRVEMGYKKQ